MNNKQVKKQGDALPKEKGLEGAKKSESYKRLIKMLGAFPKKPQQHFRVMSDEERRFLTPSAYGYVSHLVYMGSISPQLFEQIIAFALHIHLFTSRKIEKDLMDTIVNYHIFSGQESVSVRDFINIITESENEQNWNEAN